jgi:hypothetical protein
VTQQRTSFVGGCLSSLWMASADAEQSKRPCLPLSAYFQPSAHRLFRTYSPSSTTCWVGRYFRPQTLYTRVQHVKSAPSSMSSPLMDPFSTHMWSYDLAPDASDQPNRLAESMKQRNIAMNQQSESRSEGLRAVLAASIERRLVSAGERAEARSRSLRAVLAASIQRREISGRGRAETGPIIRIPTSIILPLRRPHRRVLVCRHLDPTRAVRLRELLQRLQRLGHLSKTSSLVTTRNTTATNPLPSSFRPLVRYVTGAAATGGKRAHFSTTRLLANSTRCLARMTIGCPTCNPYAKKCIYIPYQTQLLSAGRYAVFNLFSNPIIECHQIGYQRCPHEYHRSCRFTDAWYASQNLQHTPLAELSEYSLGERKIFPKGQASAGNLLKYLLREIMGDSASSRIYVY